MINWAGSNNQMFHIFFIHYKELFLKSQLFVNQTTLFAWYVYFYAYKWTGS